MFRILIGIFFYLLICESLYAQKAESFFYITGKVKVEQGLVDGTQIQVTRDGALLNNVTVNRTGNFRIKIDLNHIYRFHFNNDGFYAKTIEFDANVPPNVCNNNCVFPPYQLSLMLFKKVPGVVESNSEVGKISYNSKVDNFDAEMLRVNPEMGNKMEAILSEIKSTSKKHEAFTENQKKDKYRQAISEGDRLANAKDYEKAMLHYRDAVMIFPQIQYPRNRVNQLYSILVEEQLQKNLGNADEANFLKYLNYGDLKFNEREYTVAKVCYEKALKIKPDDITVKNKLYSTNQEYRKLQELAVTEVTHRQTVYGSRTEKYNDLVAKGDLSFQKESLAEAKEYFAQAVTQIDENSYALLMMQKIDELLSNDEAALKLAKEREAAEKERLVVARNRAYNDAVAEADNLLEQRLYRDAIEYYELALTIKSFEPYPQKQILKIGKILGKLQLEGENYNRLIREADAALYNKDYSKARPLYVEAHQLIPEELYAAQKVAEIDLLLAGNKSDEALDEKYLTFITAADKLVVDKKYTEAISVYQQASKIKPTEKYPPSQIKKIREILSRENEDQKRLLQQQNDYEKIIVSADNAFNQQSYTTARSLYQQALQVFPGQDYPIQQIDKIDRILKEKEKTTTVKSKLEQIDFSNLANVSKEDREEAYKEAMKLGESFIKSEEWGIARFYFRRALALYPSDEAANQKLTFVDTKIRGDNVNESKYNEMIKKADEAYKTGDFGVAKFYYIKAKEANPNDAYVQERINVVTRLAENSQARASNKEFDTAIAKANEALAVKNYSVARFFYRKALSLKPNDEEIKKKLAEVEALISN